MDMPSKKMDIPENAPPTIMVGRVSNLVIVPCDVNLGNLQTAITERKTDLPKAACRFKNKSSRLTTHFITKLYIINEPIRALLPTLIQRSKESKCEVTFHLEHFLTPLTGCGTKKAHND